MKCTNPFIKTSQAYGCGQCLPCRIQARRIWKTRIMLERMQYPDSTFLTLTYSDDTLPWLSPGGLRNNFPTLVPRHLQLFMKRLRKNLPHKVRFFAVGEYGDTTFRPHFHVGLFNFQNCARGETKKSLISKRCLWSECCSQCRMVGDIWHSGSGVDRTGGDIELRDLDTSKCEYLARYVTKKMTKPEDPRLEGRFPEFSRQSRRPGIGHESVRQLARSIRQYVEPGELIDVPSHLKQDRKTLLLGRYLRRKLRLALDLPEATPDAVLREAWIEQMLPLLKMAQKDVKAPSLRAQMVKANAPFEASLKAKEGLKGKGRI